MSSWSLDQRAALVRAYHSAYSELGALSFALESTTDDMQMAKMMDRSAVLFDETFALRRDYIQGLPATPLTRCPFTGQTVFIRFDPYGLDGPYWCFDAPARHREEPGAGPHFLGMSGAMRLTGAFEKTPYLVVPGPGVPFVVPLVLEDPSVQAVICAHPVGRHLGYAIAYFAKNPIQVPHRPCLWGASVTSLAADHNADEDRVERPSHFDFDLRGWVDSGRLAWIAMKDDDLMLRRGADGCPFLNLPGERVFQYLQGGEMWLGQP